MVVDHMIQSKRLDRHSFQLEIKFQIDERTYNIRFCYHRDKVRSSQKSLKRLRYHVKGIRQVLEYKRQNKTAVTYKLEIFR